MIEKCIYCPKEDESVVGGLCLDCEKKLCYECAHENFCEYHHG